MARLMRRGGMTGRRRVVRALLWSALALLLAVAAVLAYAAFAFDANGVRPRLAQWVKQKYQRELRVGDIELKLWPRVHLELSDLALSEPGAPPRAFAALTRARASLRWLPLIRGELIADTLTLEGLQLRIARSADGRWNIDDLFAPSGAPAPKFEIAQLTLRDAAVTVEDALSAARWQLAGMQLNAAPVVFGRPGELSAGFDLSNAQAGLRGKFSIAAAYVVSDPPRAVQLNRVQLRASGRWGDVAVERAQLSGNAARDAAGDWQASELRFAARAQRAAQQHEVQCSAAELRSKEGEFAVPALAGNYRRSDASGTWQASVDGPLAYQRQSAEWRSPKLRVVAQRERGAQRWRAEGSGELLGQPRAGVWLVSDLAFKLDGGSADLTLHASGQLDARARVREPAYAFAFDALKLALRRPSSHAELNTTQTATVNVTGDAVEAALQALQVRIADAQQALQLTGTAALTLSGSLAQGVYKAPTLDFSLSGTRAGAPLKVALHSPVQADLNTQRVEAPAARMEFAIGEASRALRAQVQADLRADGLRRQLRAQVSNTIFSIPPSLNIGKHHKVNLSGVLDLDWGNAGAIYRGRARVDDSNAHGQVEWSNAAGAPSYRFDVTLDRLDLDRYSARTARVAAPRAHGTPAAPRFDLEQLRALKLKGVARVGVLTSAGATAKDVKLHLE